MRSTKVVDGSSPTPRRLHLRRLTIGLALLVAGALAGGILVFVQTSGRGGVLQPWHQIRPQHEFRAGPAAPKDLAGYLELEARLFDEVASTLAQRLREFPAFSRFDPSSPTHPARFERDWNRSWELHPEGEVRGEALLLHGLSDSPYSLRAVGRLLVEGGFHVVGLRTPGHGTVPGALVASSREDWRAAVHLGVAATGGRPESSDLPFVVVGYSNGSALALDYTTHALLNGIGRVPDRLVFLSPAFAVSSVAAVAPWVQRASRLPGLEGLAWESIAEEFDPFKYNSFPVRAGGEIYGLTTELEEQLERLEAEERGLPPILTLQSVVDATIPPVASLTRLFGRTHLAEGESELVLFDANRESGIGELLGPEADELLALASEGTTFPFRVTLVTNDAGMRDVMSLSRAPNSTDTAVTPLGLGWPAEVYSLSHVAVPFPPDDAAYGVGSSPLGPPFPFGDLELKGERGVFRIPDSLLTRLRYNPFFAVVDDKISIFLGLVPRVDANADAASAEAGDSMQ